MVVRWVFTDPVTSATYQFAVNPSEGGSPQYQKNISFQATAGPAGTVLAYEGRDTPIEMTISGIIRDQAFLDALQAWWAKRYPVTVTDDLGRTFSIYITNFQPTRQRAVRIPYKHSYSMSYFIL